MRGKSSLQAFGFTILISALFCSAGGSAAEPNPKRAPIVATVQLVQSVPVETSLSQPGLPMTDQVWIDMIRGAKSTLDLAQFYLSNNHTKSKEEKNLLEPVLKELEKAADRGVKIRLLLASSLLNEDTQTLERFKKMRGSLVRVLDLSETSGGVQHAKYWIVDQKEVFVGSQNFDWRALDQIHELGARVRDPDLARQLGRIFDADWKLAKNRQDASLGYYLNTSTATRTAELVASPPSLNPSDTRPALQALLDLLNGAKRLIRVQLMDYAPLAGNQNYWPELDNALRAAAIRGVKIQILLSNSGPTIRALDYLKSLSMIPSVEIKLVTIPPFSGGYIPYARVIHSKYMTVDNEVLWLGTSNWSKGYFYNSRNIELIFRRPELAETANQIFQRLWDSMYADMVSKTLK